MLIFIPKIHPTIKPFQICTGANLQIRDLKSFNEAYLRSSTSYNIKNFKFLNKKSNLTLQCLTTTKLFIFKQIFLYLIIEGPNFYVISFLNQELRSINSATIKFLKYRKPDKGTCEIIFLPDTQTCKT